MHNGGPWRAHHTLVGVTLQSQPGLSVTAARASALQRYGPVSVIRYYDPNLPAPWPKLRATVGDRSVAVSFKSPPSQVLSGVDDERLRSWFAAAPRDRITWWTYLPEPESDVEQGDYTASEFREAWRHVDRLATEAHNDRLRSTLTLMCYTLQPASNRNWRDFYPGGAYVDVMGWDCYNFAYRRGYATPEQVFGPALSVSDGVRKPWAIPETGSLLAPGDSGAGRARWIADLTAYAKTNGAQFITFFDAKRLSDYRLLDTASQQALKNAVTGR